MSRRTLTTWTASASSLLALIAGTACRSQSPEPAEQTTVASSALWSNGSFETGAAGTSPSGWTVTPYLNPGVTITLPQTRAGLNLGTGGSAFTTILSSPGGAESQADASLGASASLRWPKYGNQVAIVNQGGKNKNTNSLAQTMTIAAADVDPSDAQVHVRFVVAPVLENPNHTLDEQPYYFVQLTNVTRNAIMYVDYNASAQPGVPWKISNGYYYTDWQLVDIAPGSAQLAVGDQVNLEVVAAGCSLGGHFGEVYVDGIGSTIPGIFVTATGPTAANAGSPITYKLKYENGGATAVAGTTVSFNTPDGTVFQSISAPGLTCSTPVVGTSGLVTCVVGSLAAGGSGSFDVTTLIQPTTTGTLTEGNYSIYGTSVSPLLGPKVYTTVTSGITYADLVMTASDDATGVIWGQGLTYTIVAQNPTGPNAVTGATVTDTFPANLHNITWTCVGANGGSCAASGTGNIADSTVALPVGGTVTYTAHTTIVNGTGSGQVANIPSVQLPVGAVDFSPTNNAAGVYNAISSSNGSSCILNTDCFSGLCDLAGGICIPAGGCGADLDCAGTPNTWCNTQTFACVPKIPNGGAVPTVGGHNPTLDGNCTGVAATAVCVTSVCDPSDNECGLNVGGGPCTTATHSVCRSGACSLNGTCEPLGGCNVDTDCGSGNWCDAVTNVCVPKIANGGSVPSDLGHTPLLDGHCSLTAAAAVCQSGVCDSDDRCGYANADGVCTSLDAGIVCRSGACDPNDLKCGYANSDGPCSNNDALCRSNICDIDGLCGYGNGDGPCTSGDETTTCRSLICATTGPLAGKCGQCATSLDCVSPSGACETTTATCRQCTASDASACVGSSPVCDSATDSCGACDGDNASAGTHACPSTMSPYCNLSGLTLGSCGRCTDNLDCVGTHNGPICDLASGACGTHCTLDSDCKTDNSEWCDAGVCTPKTANGLPLPSADPIDATCTPANGARVCVTGVCDTDNVCGLLNGDGACNDATGSAVCRSNVCTTTMGAQFDTCEECNGDGDCLDPQKPACDTNRNICVQCSATNKTQCSGIAPTCSVLTETCSGCDADNGSASANACSTAAAPYCETTGQCGLCSTSNDCLGMHAGPVCDTVSGACGTTCHEDADCNNAAQWCSADANTSGICLPKLDNGTPLPTTPSGLATCTSGVGQRVCISGVCDAVDNKCGLEDGAPCTAAAECRVGACTNDICAPATSGLPPKGRTPKVAGATPSTGGDVEPIVALPGKSVDAPDTSGDEISGGGGLFCSTSLGGLGSNSMGALAVLVGLGLLGAARRRKSAAH